MNNWIESALHILVKSNIARNNLAQPVGIEHAIVAELEGGAI